MNLKLILLSGQTRTAMTTDIKIPNVLNHNGYKIPLRFRHNANSKRIILRIDQENDGALITIPPNIGAPEVLALINDKAEWLIEKIEALPPRRFLGNCEVFLLMGDELTIRHLPDARLGVRLIGSEIFVSGREEHLPRRLIDWLKQYARRTITPKANEMASRLNRKIIRISIRDTKSRWGSCSHRGSLSFCWRLIMAPEWVLNYVIAHEVSHLVHMNHSSDFWSTVALLEAKPERARKWLNQHGDSLRRVGPKVNI